MEKQGYTPVSAAPEDEDAAETRTPVPPAQPGSVHIAFLLLLYVFKHLARTKITS